MLQKIAQVTTSLHTVWHSLADCRDDLGALTEAVEDEKREQISAFYAAVCLRSTLHQMRTVKRARRLNLVLSIFRVV